MRARPTPSWGRVATARATMGASREKYTLRSTAASFISANDAPDTIAARNCHPTSAARAKAGYDSVSSSKPATLPKKTTNTSRKTRGWMTAQPTPRVVCL